LATSPDTRPESAAPRHAEIAGGGLGGLCAASILARRGWTVRVHERAEQLREIGAGIFLWENALRALADADAFEDATRLGERIRSWKLYDERRRLIQGEWMNPDGVRLITARRTDLHRALGDAARRAGVEIVTSSEAIGADPQGALLLAGGERLPADLVVAADGVGSKVRDSLGLASSVTDLQDGCGRHLIPRLPDDPETNTLEYWNGGRRVGIVPCSPDEVYVYLCCTAGDTRGRATPVDQASWIEAFPNLRDTIERIPDTGRWASFHDVVCRSWSSGRVAIIGDAAHAMSPNLGQAACLAMANGRTLAHALDRYDDVPTGLRAWEASERPVTEATQRYSRVYGRIGTQWPRPLLDLRSAVVKIGGRTKRIQAKANLAAGWESGLVLGDAVPAGGAR
jgi:2-polyprenyl-6-methoxyphenol hydroxylase-like FAD-dependent oxidoreductase